MFTEAITDSMAAIRRRVDNVEMDLLNDGWQFDFNGERWFAKDNNGSPIMGEPNSEPFKAWIVRQILDRKHRRVRL